jgi:hypothetical protein
MRCAQITRVAALAVALTLLAPHAAVAAGDKGKPGSCNITTGGIGPGGDTAICNYGLTPEELKQVTEAAVKGATGPLIDRIADISKTLGVTEDAAKTLLKIVGEDPNIPEDKLAEALTRVAGDYKRLEAQVAALNPDNPTAKALVEQAKPEIEAGHFQRAHELLGQATQAQVAAAQQAYQIQEQARVAGDAQMLGAASSTSADGEVATTERRYLEPPRCLAKPPATFRADMRVSGAAMSCVRPTPSTSRATSAGTTTRCAARLRSTGAR